jgi:hypothetical protein
MAATMLLCLVFLLLVAGAFLVAGLAWSPLAGGVMLVLAFATLLALIPSFLNFSRSFFGWLFLLLAVHICATLSTYAIHYARFGLAVPGGVTYAFRDALYFSITTWTTLGYGDFAPIPLARAAASLEALTGIATIPLMAAMLWLWCSENMLPKDLALWDGTRRREGSICVQRMRVRTITGKEKELDGWTYPAKLGEAFRFDDVGKCWVQIDEDEELSEGTRVLDREPR